MLVALALALFGVVGNGLCLASIVLRCYGWHQNPGLINIFSLAINDIVVCLLLSFTELAELVPRSLLPALPPAIAYTIPTALVACDMIENCHLIVMAANRFVAIMTPLRYAATFTPERTKRLCAFGWLVGPVCAIPYTLVCWPAYYSLREGSMVHDYKAGACSANTIALFEAPFYALFLVCFLVVVVAYVPITVKIYRLQRSELSNTGIDARMCVQFLLVVSIWLTAYVFYIFFVTTGYTASIGEILVLLIYSSNPVIYWIFNKTIKNGIYALWKKELSVTTNTIKLSTLTHVNETTNNHTVTVHS